MAGISPPRVIQGDNSSQLSGHKISKNSVLGKRQNDSCGPDQCYCHIPRHKCRRYSLVCCEKCMLAAISVLLLQSPNQYDL